MFGTDSLDLFPYGLNLKCPPEVHIFFNGILSQMPALLCKVVESLGVGSGWQMWATDGRFFRSYRPA